MTEKDFFSQFVKFVLPFFVNTYMDENLQRYCIAKVNLIVKYRHQSCDCQV